MQTLFKLNSKYHVYDFDKKKQTYYLIQTTNKHFDQTTINPRLTLKKKLTTNIVTCYNKK
jgi:hypothetical protein